jgi:prepilin-type processing-associated H-X9-DG protein
MGPVWTRSRQAAGGVAAGASLRMLVAANGMYAGDNNNYYCPADNIPNTVQWCAAKNGDGSWNTTSGFLSPYFSSDGLKQDPNFTNYIKGPASWEDGCGGFGYNEIYIGGTAADPFHGINVARVQNPSHTIMFATTAFAMSGGEMQEYPFCDPPYSVNTDGSLGGSLQPSTHFRCNGQALVAWCDGHVTYESPNSQIGPNYYGGDNEAANTGWFGPTENNGYWNPDYNGPADTTSSTH